MPVSSNGEPYEICRVALHSCIVVGAIISKRDSVPLGGSILCTKYRRCRYIISFSIPSQSAKMWGGEFCDDDSTGGS